MEKSDIKARLYSFISRIQPPDIDTVGVKGSTVDTYLSALMQIHLAIKAFFNFFLTVVHLNVFFPMKNMF